MDGWSGLFSPELLPVLRAKVQAQWGAALETGQQNPAALVHQSGLGRAQRGLGARQNQDHLLGLGAHEGPLETDTKVEI